MKRFATLLLFALLGCATLSAQYSNITPAPLMMDAKFLNYIPIEKGEFDFTRELKLYFDISKHSKISPEDRERLIAAAEAAGLNFEVVKRQPRKNAMFFRCTLFHTRTIMRVTQF